MNVLGWLEPPAENHLLFRSQLGEKSLFAPTLRALKKRPPFISRDEEANEIERQPLRKASCMQLLVVSISLFPVIIRLATEIENISR